MSISEALGIAEEKLFKNISNERIKHIGEDDGEPIETSSSEVKIFVNNKDDRKALEGLYGLR